MKFRVIGAVCAGSLMMTVSVATMSALLDRGGGLIYDTDLDITWLQDANYAKTSGYDADGRITWHSAMSWAAGLSYYDSVRNRTWTDWRLPSARNPDGSGPCFGFDCPDSEVGHLYFVDGIKRGAPGPFTNFQGTYYWTNTGRAPFPGIAWLFGFFDAKQDFTGPLEDLLLVYAWAVRDGDVADSVAIAPTANNDSASVDEGLRVSIDLASNDTDADDGLDLGSINIASGPSNGSISAIGSDGTVEYTHNGSETVADSFTYTIDDVSGVTSNLASVDITVNPQNDAPLANDDSGTVNAGDVVTLDLAVNDTDADDGLDLTSIAIVGVPADGDVSVNADGSIAYAPLGSSTASTDTFTYTISDQAAATSNIAIVTISINPADSNGDGISDAQATAIRLDPDDADGDTDNDMISDVIEVGGDIGNPLDSDADGVIDALEPGVAADDASVASKLALGGGVTVSITTAVGETLSNVTSGAVSGAPTGITFPLGTVSYTTTAPVGGIVMIRMSFSNDLPDNLALFKADDTGLLTELPSEIWSQVDARTLDVTLTDGDLATDLDGIANGSIDDPIAIASVAPAATPPPETGGGGGGGCTVNARAHKDPTLPLLALAALGWLLRRKILGQETLQ